MICIDKVLYINGKPRPVAEFLKLPDENYFNIYIDGKCVNQVSGSKLKSQLGGLARKAGQVDIRLSL